MEKNQDGTTFKHMEKCLNYFDWIKNGFWNFCILINIQKLSIYNYVAWTFLKLFVFF